MKLRRVAIENVRSFLDRQEFLLPGDISILIGPNGGGKTNLLDTAFLALRLFVLKSWMYRETRKPDGQDNYDWMANDALNPRLLEKHCGGAMLPQSIELDLELTGSDRDSIMRSNLRSPEERARSRYSAFPGSSPASWNTDGLEAGALFKFQIVNGVLKPASSPVDVTFRSYLETYEVNLRVREESELQPPSLPMIYLPFNRSAGEVSTTVSLAHFNDQGTKKTIDAASSRVAGGQNQLISLAIGRLATYYRELLERDDGRAKQAFMDEPGNRKLTAILESLGYGWDLQCTNPLRNEYDIRLSKQGASFNVGVASSGERELLTYIFAIYALNVRDALIVVDEPELHLHPRWQRTLLKIFERLARETGNQFVMATHSPAFVSPSSIQYVSRVYSESQQSRVVRLGDTLPERKHLFNIVNSQNNERVFFADLVVLVEGISDRIFFDALLRHFKLGEGTSKVYETVSVGGKGFFRHYEMLLVACHVPYVVIADLDYTREIGSESLKALFSVSEQAVKQKVIDDPASLDGRSLLARMDEAMATGCINDLSPLWEYVKSRQTRLRTTLTELEQRELDSFIVEQRQAKRFVLKRGTLESYLPDGFKGKDIERVIQLATCLDLWDRLPPGHKGELEEIVKALALYL